MSGGIRLLDKVRQGIDESLAYSDTTTANGSSPTNITVVVYDMLKTSVDDWVDVTDEVLEDGAASVVGDVITLPRIGSLTASHRYRVEIQYTVGGNTFEDYFIIIAET